MKYVATITFDNDEQLDVVVEAEICPGEKMTFDYPGSPACAEVITVKNAETGEDITETLTDKQFAHLEAETFEEDSKRREGAYDAMINSQIDAARMGHNI